MCETKSYFVRTCYRTPEGQLVSPSSFANGFIWPEEIGSVVVAPDWDPSKECGHGLHGLRPGDNCPGCWAFSPNAVWMVCSYNPETAVMLGGKIKVPSCTIEYVVDMNGGASTLVPLWLRERGATEPIYRGFIEVGERTAIVVGEDGVAKAGDYGFAQAGNNGVAIATRRGKAVAGMSGVASTTIAGESHAGNWGYAISGTRGTSITGDDGYAISQSDGTAKVGQDGYAIVGFWGTAIAGDYGVACTGEGGKAQAGRGGIIQIVWYPNINDCVRRRIVIGYVGEDGIEPDTLYKLDEQGKFVKVELPHE